MKVFKYVAHAYTDDHITKFGVQGYVVAGDIESAFHWIYNDMGDYIIDCNIREAMYSEYREYKIPDFSGIFQSDWCE